MHTEEVKKLERKIKRFTARLKSSKGIVCSDIPKPNIIICNAGQGTGLEKEYITELISNLSLEITPPKYIAEKGETHSFLSFKNTDDANLFVKSVNGKAIRNSGTPLILCFVDNEIPSSAVYEVNDLLDDPIQTSVFKQAREEPEKIKMWREEQKKRLEEKDAEEERKRQEMLLIAKKELEDWYKTHDEQIAKTKAANRESAKNAEKALARGSEGDTAEGGEWARVAELCDFGPRRGRDVARLRSIVLQLKQAGSKPNYPPRTTKVA